MSTVSTKRVAASSTRPPRNLRDALSELTEVRNITVAFWTHADGYTLCAPAQWPTDECDCDDDMVRVSDTRGAGLDAEDAAIDLAWRLNPHAQALATVHQPRPEVAS